MLSSRSLLEMLPFALLLSLASSPACKGGLSTDGTVTDHSLGARDLAIEVEDGAALLHVVDRLRPNGDGVVLTSYSLALPAGRAVVVDAVLESKAGKVRSEIVAADEAAARFEELENALRYGSLEPPPSRGTPQAAILVGHLDDGAEVRVAAPCGLGAVRVRLTVRLATDPTGGRWRLSLPTTEGVRVRRLDVPGRDWRRADDGSLLVERGDGELRGRLALHPLPSSPDRELVRAELDLPRRLVDERPIAVVAVVDGSVSFGEDRALAALALLERMLAEAPAGSAYAVVLMARYPTLVVPPWTPSSSREPLAGVARALKLENGSDLVAALRLAKSLVADAGEREGRVVVVGDLERARRFTDDELVVATAGGQALTHIVEVQGEGASFWWRAFAADGDEPLAAGAEGSGGVLVHASLVREEPDVELARYLVRPTKLERPRVVAARGHEIVVDSSLTMHASDARSPFLVVEAASASEEGGGALPDEIAEGGGLRVTGIVRPLLPVSELAWRAEGFLWATPARFPLRPTRATERLLPALAAVNDVADELDDEAVLSLSRESGAVSRAASRLGLPAWRPPSSDSVFGFGCSCGCSSCMGGGRFGTVCHAGGSSTERTHPTHAQQLEAWLALHHRERCGPSGHELSVEWGRHEILDVEPTGEYGAVERCYLEALWALRLDRDDAIVGSMFERPGDVVVTLPE